MQSYDNKIASGGSAGFCNDRNTRNGDSWVSSGTTFYYAAYERIWTNDAPSYECSNTNDMYTTKIGLITADEVAYAGGRVGTSNYGYYLYTGNNYWTMSPSYVDSLGYAYVFRVYSYGSLSNNYVYATCGVRPVINLNANITITGSGTISNPYVIENVKHL